MTKLWSEVADSEGFKALSPEEQDGARRQYFNDVVAPQVPTEHQDIAWNQFATDTGVGKRSLPVGMAPSAAGAGRGNVVPTTPTDTDPVPATDPMGSGDAASIMAVAAPKRTSILEGLYIPEPASDSGAEPRHDYAAILGQPSAAPYFSSGSAQPTSREELAGNYIKDMPLPLRAVVKAATGIGQGYGGGMRAVGELTGMDRLATAGANLVQRASDVEKGMGDITHVDGFGPKSPVPYLANMAEGAASSLGQSATYAAAFGPEAVIPMMSLMTAGQEYDKAREAGQTPGMALAGALPKGAFEAIGEKFTGLDKVAGAMGVLLTKGATNAAKRDAGMILMKAGVREIPGEVVTYLGQSGVDLIPGIGLNPNMTMTQFVDGLRDTVVQAAMMGGTMGATGAHVAQKSPDRQSAEDLAKSKGFLVREEGIKALRGAGEKAAADLMQQKHDVATAEESVDGELAKLPGNEAFAQQYRGMRIAGVKPAEAAARSAVTVTFSGLASASGVPDAAVARAMDKAKDMPLQKVPGFLHKFVAGLASRGLINPTEGLSEIGQSLETARDEAMDAAMGALYRPVKPTMDAVVDLESQQKAPEEPVEQAPAAIENVATPAQEVDLAAHDAATSPLNSLPEPTQAQKEAGNYKVGRVNLHGLNISIENPEGSVRRGVGEDGKPWENELAAHYGYIRGTEGNDGDHVDTFIGPNPESQKVFVVDQINKDGSFDEHKVILGTDSLQQADDLYHANYHAGWTGRGAITEMPMAEFKKWVKDGTKTEPVGALPALDPATAPVGAQAESQSAAVGADVATAATDQVTHAVTHYGRDNVPLTDGGKAFRTRRAADDARKLNPMMRVVRAEGGFALTEKTPAQLAAQEKAAKRLRNPQTSAKGEPIPAHAMIAAAGGLAPDTRADMGMQGNVQIGNRKLFAGTGKGLTIERATERLVEEGYLSSGASHDDARDLIKRSLTKPQYNAEGYERLAELDSMERFDAAQLAEDDAVAEIEALSDNQFDALLDADIPWDAASNTDTEAAMRALGFTEQEIQDATANQPGEPQDGGASRGGADEGAASQAQADPGRREEAPPEPEEVAQPQTPAPAGVSVSDDKFQPVTQFDKVNVGPGGYIKPRIIAAGQPTYRETDIGGLDQLMREDRYAVPFNGFVADRAELALGQGRNRGVQVIFRPDSVSGREHAKPMTGDLAGREYRTDLLAPSAVQTVTMKMVDEAKLRSLTRMRLKAEFDRTEIAKGKVQYSRKGLPVVAFPEPEPVVFDITKRPDGTLAVLGDPDAIREALEEIPKRSLSPMKDGILVGRTQADIAMAILQPAELTAPTKDDVLAQQERADKAAKDKAAADRAAEKQAAEDEDRKRIAKASEAAADTFELGGDAMANLTGQKDIFSDAPMAKLEPAKIEDAGEKIGGARKDRWKDRGLDLTDLDSMSESEGAELATKANVWKPDYEAMAEATEPVTAAMVKTVYDQLAAQPKKNTPEGRRDYVQMMQIVRKVYTEAKSPDDVKNGYLKVRALAGLNHADTAVSKQRAKEVYFSVYKGRSDPFVLGYNELSKAKKMVEQGFPGKVEPWTKRLSLRSDGGSGVTTRGVEVTLRNAAEVGTPLTEDHVKAGFWRVVDKAGKSLAYLPTKADAEAAAKTIYERDLKKGPSEKVEPVRPNLDALKRENLTKRIDRDANAEDFVKAFGFRGVEFGNWAAQDERQRIINMAYDGLMDLAEIMGVPPKAMSLNGTLGMAFGARGGGKASAHYEPGKLVINMTKINGGGSMAHEWAHALDHYFGELNQADAYTTKARGASGWYDEQQYKGLPMTRMEKDAQGKWANVTKMRLDKLRPEMARAFDGVMSALFSGQETKAQMVRSEELAIERYEALADKETDAEMKAMYQRGVESRKQFLEELRKDPDDKTYPKGRSAYAGEARKLVGKAATGYWTRPTEMFARAFESWVFDKVAAMGARSDYLVHGVEEDRFAGGGYKGNPYPTGAERATINAAFDKLASTILTKETDKGTALYALGPDAFRRGIVPRKFMPVSEVQKAVEEMSKSWTNGPTIKVVATPDDLPGAAPSDARGRIQNGIAYVVASNHADRAGVARTLAHEAIGHYGLWKALGTEGTRRFHQNLQLALASGNKALVELSNEVRNRYKDEHGNFNLSPAMEANEIAALAVEQGVDADGNFKPGFGFLKHAWAQVADFLRRLGFKINFTNAELHGMLVASMKGLQAGKRLDGAETAMVAAARDGDGLPDVSDDRTGVAVTLLHLGQSNDLYRYPRSDSLELEHIAEDKGGSIRVSDVDKASDNNKLWMLSNTTPDDNPKTGVKSWILTLPNDKYATLTRKGNEVYINVSGVGEGFGGSEVYDLASNYALNNGLTFIGDPNGVSPAAMRRRLENMLSSAIKYGTTEHLQPHDDQYLGNEAIGVPPLDWTKGDTLGNIRSMVDVSIAANEHANPVATQLVNFEPGTQSFRDEGGNPVPDEDLAGYLSDMLGFEQRQAGVGSAGRTTLQRNALFKSLVQGTGARRALLESVRRLQADGGSGVGGGLSQSFYARGGVTSGLFTPTVWNTPDPTRTDRIIYELQDGRIDLKRVQQAIEKSGQQIDEKWDARLAETLYPGRVANRTQTFLKVEAKPLLEAMAVHKVTMDELADYLHARGAEERNKQVAKVNPDMPDGGAGTNTKGVLMTTQAAADYLANVRPDRKAVLDALAKRVDAITAGTRSLLVSEGLEKQETIDAWQAVYKNYVPMFRDEAQSGAPHPQGSGFSVKGSASKRAMGSSKEVTNILAHVLMQREAAITRAEKNRVALALYGQALSHPNPEFWTTIKPSMSAKQIGAELVNMGIDPMTAQLGMEGVPTIPTIDPVSGKVVHRPNPMYKNLPGAIPLKVNGEDRVLMLNANNPRSARMAESLKNLDGLTQLDLAGSIIGKATRWLAAVNTQYNPAFGLVNLTRDTLGGSINLGSTELRGNALKVLSQTPAAIFGIARELAKGGQTGKWQTLYRQFQADGGQTGYKENFRDANDRAKAVQDELLKLQRAGTLHPARAAHAILDLLDGFNTTLENAVRLSAYKAALDQGMSNANAARLGRELTVDFNRKGRAGRELGPLYAFFNASTQGIARGIQTLKGPTGAKVIAGGLSLGILQAIMLAAAGYDDDEIPEFVKTRSLIIPILGGEKRYVAIPYPLELQMIPNTSRVLTELVLNGGKDIGKRIFDAIGTVAGSFNPMGGGNILTADGALKTLAPTLIDPLIELGFNKNFAGGTIEKAPYGGETDNRPGVARAKESTQRSTTGQVYMAISKIINSMTGGTDYEAGKVSPTPERVRYLAQTVGGGVLRELEKVVNASTVAQRGEPVKPSQIPVLGRFYGEVDGQQTTTSRYLENTKKLRTAESSYKAIVKAGDYEAAEAFSEKNPETLMLHSMHQIQAALAKLNKQAVQVVNDPKEMAEIDKTREVLMQELNDGVRELENETRGPTPAAKIKAWRKEAVTP